MKEKDELEKINKLHQKFEESVQFEISKVMELKGGNGKGLIQESNC